MVGPHSQFNREQVLHYAKTAKKIAVDTEGTGLDVRDGRDHAYGVSLACRSEKGSLYAAYFPFKHKTPTGEMDPDNISEEMQDEVREILNSGAAEIVMHNSKYDLFALETLDIFIKGPFIDTMLIAHLVNENLPVMKSLDACYKRYVGGTGGKEKSDALEAYIKLFGWSHIPVFLLDRYAEVDAKITLELLEALEKKVDFE